MPQCVVADFVAPPNMPHEQISDDELRSIAGHFGVSEHAALVRLVELQYVNPNYYWNVKRSQFDEAAKKHKDVGRSSYYGSRFRNKQGDLYTGLVIEAWSTGRITGHNAAEYMGTSIEHMRQIREQYGV